jgi:uncharacterized protein YeaO (DUF488 family)
MAVIRMKRWNDPPEAGDGTRILICRYRPRGLPKEDETWDEWLVSLAPSKQLHAAAYGKTGGSPLPWPMYRSRYLKEMQSQRDTIRELAERVTRGETVTLMCSSACERDSRCHRSLLKELIEAEAIAIQPRS